MSTTQIRIETKSYEFIFEMYKLTCMDTRTSIEYKQNFRSMGTPIIIYNKQSKYA